MSERLKTQGEIPLKEQGISREVAEISIERVNKIKRIVEDGKIDMPEELKEAINDMAENMFGHSESMIKNGLEKYKEASTGIGKTQYAAAVLESMTETIQGEKREFSDLEKENLKNIFEEATRALRGDGFSPEAANLEIIAKNVDVVVRILKLEKD